MSPEQITRPRSLDVRSDVYSFGCVFYEMLTGRPPFVVEHGEGDTDFHLKQMHVSKAPTPPRDLNPSIPKRLDGLILVSLAKEPDQRFAGAGQFRTALHELNAPNLPQPSVDEPPAREEFPAPPIKVRYPQLSARINVVGHLSLLLLAPALIDAMKLENSVSQELAFTCWVFDMAWFLLRPLYRAWQALRGGSPRTTSGAAVARLFIPIYHFYWIFQVWPGFARDYNAMVSHFSFKVPPRRQGKYVVFCVCHVLLGLSVLLAGSVWGAETAGATLGAGIYLELLLAYPWVLGDVCQALTALSRAQRQVFAAAGSANAQ
jgi:hypothetical protein